MSKEIDDIFRTSAKAELLEILPHELENFDKAIITLIQDKDKGAYDIKVLTLNIQIGYETFGILEATKMYLQEEDY